MPNPFHFLPKLTASGVRGPQPRLHPTGPQRANCSPQGARLNYQMLLATDPYDVARPSSETSPRLPDTISPRGAGGDADRPRANPGAIPRGRRRPLVTRLVSLFSSRFFSHGPQTAPGPAVPRPIGQRLPHAILPADHINQGLAPARGTPHARTIQD